MADILPESPVFTSTGMGPLKLRNRFVRSAAFEGMCQGGLPSEALLRYHQEVSAGGVGMTIVAYASVSEDGRTYPHQLSMKQPGVVEGLRRVTDAIHLEGAAAGIQLGHCGYFASKPLIGTRPIGPSVVYNTYGLTFPRKMRETDLSRVTDDFEKAARMAVEAGFDAVEVQACHGYLLSQFLSPFTNRRQDSYGGPLENRLRFPLAVLRRVREAVGPKVAVMVKMNLRDGFEGGMELDEAVEVAKAFEAEGADALFLSGGFVSKVPMYVMRGDIPFKEFYRGQTTLTKKIGILLMGRIMIKEFPFEEAYFLEDAREVRRAVKLPLILVGGLRTLSKMESIVREGFEFLGMARPLIMEPDLVNKLRRGEQTASKCEPCNKCIGLMDKGSAECLLLKERGAAQAAS